MPTPASNLVRYDFSDPDCYPGTGTSVTNLTNSATFLGTLVGAGFSSLTNSFQFDSSDQYIYLDDINLSNNFTYIFVFSRSSPLTSGTQTLLSTPFRNSWDQLPYYGVYFAYNNSTNDYDFNTNNSSTYVLSSFSPDNTTGEWTVAGLTFSSGTANLYINGIGVSTVTGLPSSIDLNVATQTSIGNYASFFNPDDGQFTGQIAAFEAYNTVLSSGDISDISTDYLNRYVPQPESGSVMGGRIFGEGFNG